MRRITLYLLALTLVMAGCREDDVIFIPEQVHVAEPVFSSVRGFYLLNEANMSSNKATLDYYDMGTGYYMRNIFGKANPGVPKEMGDVGNDIAAYGSHLFCVINCSNKVDVLDKNTCVKKAQIDIPNCRFIAFSRGYAYVTSYAGPVMFDTEYKQRGYVAKIDTVTMQVVDTCVVGFQPDGLEIVEDKIYVCNSGGYMFPNYENTLSVIDIATFREVERVPIAINLYLCQCDRRGVLWVSSRGDYNWNGTTGFRSDIYAYDTRKHRIIKAMDCRVSNMWMDGDSLYVVSNEWNNITMSADKSFALINTATMQVVDRSFIKDGTDRQIQVPYGIAVDPVSKDIYVTDAKDYVSPGQLFCYDRYGIKKWEVRTGDIPAHFCFMGDDLNDY